MNIVYVSSSVLLFKNFLISNVQFSVLKSCAFWMQNVYFWLLCYLLSLLITLNNFPIVYSSIKIIAEFASWTCMLRYCWIFTRASVIFFWWISYSYLVNHDILCRQTVSLAPFQSFCLSVLFLILVQQQGLLARYCCGTMRAASLCSSN